MGGPDFVRAAPPGPQEDCTHNEYNPARKLDACSADATDDALHHAMKRLPSENRQTLTVDNGREFTRHQDIGPSGAARGLYS